MLKYLHYIHKIMCNNSFFRDSRKCYTRQFPNISIFQFTPVFVIGTPKTKHTSFHHP